jgi:hypothetical protein
MLETPQEYLEKHQLEYYLLDSLTLLKQQNPTNKLDFLQQ